MRGSPNRSGLQLCTCPNTVVAASRVSMVQTRGKQLMTTSRPQVWSGEVAHHSEGSRVCSAAQPKVQRRSQGDLPHSGQVSAAVYCCTTCQHFPDG